MGYGRVCKYKNNNFLLSLELLCRETMGRRKSKRKPPPKKKMTGNLDTQFTCPFCNHEKSCDVKMLVNHCNSLSFWTVCIMSIMMTITVFQGKNPQYGDNIMQRLFGGVPDSYNVYPFDHYKKWYICRSFTLTWIWALIVTLYLNTVWKCM